MKILFLDQFSEMGGAQRVLLDTVEAAQRRGWTPYVAVPGDGPLVQQLRAQDVTVAGIPCGPYTLGGKKTSDVIRFSFDLRAQARIIRNLANRFDYDLLYVNGPRLLPAAALARGRRAAILFHAHNHVRHVASERLAGWSLRGAGATVVACSHAVLAPLRPYIGGKSHVIPNGVREIPFRQPMFGREGCWRVGVIARISPEKGQAEFLRAAAAIAKDYHSVRFTLCGSPLFGDSAMRIVFDVWRWVCRWIFSAGVRMLPRFLPNSICW